MLTSLSASAVATVRPSPSSSGISAGLVSGAAAGAAEEALPAAGAGAAVCASRATLGKQAAERISVKVRARGIERSPVVSGALTVIRSHLDFAHMNEPAPAA